MPVSDTPFALPRAGELSPALSARASGLSSRPMRRLQGLPGRPPALCPGCPHRLVFKELSRMRAIVTGDIGCYTLGALPPLSAMDTTVDMGASVSMAHGFELALAGTEHRPVVAVIGDSRSPIRLSRSSPRCTTAAPARCVLDKSHHRHDGASGSIQRRPPATSRP